MAVGGGGRRDGENSGRERVNGIELRGIAHNGFAVAARTVSWSGLGAESVGTALSGRIAVPSSGAVAARTEARERPYTLAPRTKPTALRPGIKRSRVGLFSVKYVAKQRCLILRPREGCSSTICPSYRSYG